MRAGGIDAFAAPVREGEAAALADEVGQPAGKIAAHHVAVARRHRPARHQAEGNRIRRPPGKLPAHLGEIEQAEVVLAPLADDRPSAPSAPGWDRAGQARRSIWCCRCRVKVLIQTGPWLRSAQRLAGAI